MTISTTNLTYDTKEKSILQNISLDFEPGKIYGILGPNGSGKTTFLKCLCGIWKPSQGQVNWSEIDLHKLPRNKISQIVSIVPQVNFVPFDFTTYDMIKMGRYSHSSLNEQLIEKTMRDLNLWHLKNQSISQLSGGEKQRVYIARSLITEAPVLLLDEPTTHLDLYHQFEVWKILKRLVTQERTIIVTLHDLSAASIYCDEIIVFNYGACIAQGTYADTVTPQLLKNVFGIY